MSSIASTHKEQRTRPNRVTYQGMTFTICRKCYEVIGSGRGEEILLALEQFHRCTAMDPELEQEYATRIYGDQQSG